MYLKQYTSIDFWLDRGIGAYTCMKTLLWHIYCIRTLKQSCNYWGQLYTTWLSTYLMQLFLIKNKDSFMADDLS